MPRASTCTGALCPWSAHPCSGLSFSPWTNPIWSPGLGDSAGGPEGTLLLLGKSGAHSPAPSAWAGSRLHPSSQPAPTGGEHEAAVVPGW